MEGRFVRKILILILVLTNCIIMNFPQNFENSQNQKFSAHASDLKQESNDKKNIELKIDLKKEKEIQISVDDGHQPWRLEPIDVSHVALIEAGKSVKYEDCTILSETDDLAEVECKGNKENYIVHLKRLIDKGRGGIWTAVSIDEFGIGTK